MTLDAVWPVIDNNLTGASVLVTGVTGFLGKSIVEHIFTHTPSVKKVYVVIRRDNKRDISAESRFKTLLQHPYFASYPSEILSKLQVVEGDVSCYNLGIEDSDCLNELQNNVNVIMHCAADVSFDQGLVEALHSNVKPILNFHNFAQDCKNLKVWLHVSTAYVSCNNISNKSNIVAEDENSTTVINQIPVQQLIEYLSQASQKELSLPHQQLINSLQTLLMQQQRYPNTYCATKACAEACLKYFSTQVSFPVVCVRPSIVSPPSCSNRFAGFLDSIKGIAPLAFASASGYLPLVRASPSLLMDLVPVDHVCKVALASVSWAMKQQPKPSSMLVLHATSTNKTPVTAGFLFGIYRSIFSNQPLLGCSAPTLTWCQDKAEFDSKFQCMFQGICSARRRKVADVVQKIHTIFGHFMENEWIFEDTKAYEILQSQGLAGLKNFDWQGYLECCSRGMRPYWLKILRKTQPFAYHYYTTVSKATDTFVVYRKQYMVLLTMVPIIVSAGSLYLSGNSWYS